MINDALISQDIYRFPESRTFYIVDFETKTGKCKELYEGDNATSIYVSINRHAPGG